MEGHVSEDNSGRDKQPQSVEQADGDQAAYLDSLIAQFQDDVDMDLANDADLPEPSDNNDDYYDDDHELIEPVPSDAVLTESNTSPSQSTTPVEAGKPEKTTDPTIILLAGLVIAIVLSTAIWLALHGDDDKHPITETGQPASQSSPPQTAIQPVVPASMDQQTAPAPITASENREAPVAMPADQIEEHAVAPEQVDEHVAAADQTEEQTVAPEQSNDLVTPSSEQLEESPATPGQSEEPAAAPEQVEPSAPSAQQEQAQPPTQTAPSPTTIPHLEIDPVSRKVIAPQPANTRMVWAVNLTSVSTLAIAAKVRESLDNRGVATELVWVTIGGQSYYRIRIPGFTSKRKATRALRAYMKEREFSSAWIENYHPLPRTSE